MMNNKPSIKFKIIQETLEQSDNVLHIKTLCEIAGVSRAGYYKWIRAEPKRQEREQKDQNDFALILKAYQHRGYNKGARSIYMHLLHQQPPIMMNLKKIRRLMEKYNLFCPIRKANPYRRMMRAMRTSHVSPNLLDRNFTTLGPRMALLTDITYIPFNGTFCYLSTILDAFTRQILAYVVSDSLEVDFVLETVLQLVQNHGVSLQSSTILHSDQGCHYTSYKFIRIVKDQQLRQSMSRRGNCWDNAPQESFFGHMKDEVSFADCTSFQQVKTIIDDWIDYYNNERYQWQLAKLSPNEYYRYITSGDYPLPIPPP